MIAVNINAGLANKMFHYAFGQGLKYKGLDIIYDTVNFKPRTSWSFEDISLRDAFPDIDLPEMEEGHFKWALTDINETPRFKKRISRYIRKFYELIGYEKYIFESSYAYINGMEKQASHNCIYRGFWQSEKYFNHCKDEVRNQFKFLPFDESENIILSRKMTSENSVAIHLRKGADYLQSDLMGKGLCPVSYYQDAIEHIRRSVENPVFYVFTDNPEWVKTNLPDFEYTLVDWNPVSGKKSFRDMQLMSCAKHNIIANSTYSWWGAWLNPNPNKIVIAPKKFFNPISPFFAKTDIICDDWVRL